MTRLTAYLAALLLVPFSCMAGDTISELEGVYKIRGKTEIVVPGAASELIDTEDVLEVVRYDDKHAYFRTRVIFANGHTCTQSGIAEQRGKELIYRETANVLQGYPVCVLKIRRAGDKISLTDRWEAEQSTDCSSSCGFRGSLHDVTFPFKSKRVIRYLPRLKESRQYVGAVAELKGKSDPRRSHAKAALGGNP